MPPCRLLATPLSVGDDDADEVEAEVVDVELVGEPVVLAVPDVVHREPQGTGRAAPHATPAAADLELLPPRGPLAPLVHARDQQAERRFGDELVHGPGGIGRVDDSPGA